MNELIWYIFQNGKQIGPFENNQLNQMIVNGMVNEDAYLFKAGWKEWRPIEDVSDELKMISQPPGTSGALPKKPEESEKLADRRNQAPRATIKGQIIVHNGGNLALGQGANISTTGIFIETKENLFYVGEKLSITVRCEGIGKPFNALAEVVRHNADEQYGTGYGLRFYELREDHKQRIEDLVEKANTQ